MLLRSRWCFDKRVLHRSGVALVSPSLGAVQVVLRNGQNRLWLSSSTPSLSRKLFTGISMAQPPYLVRRGARCTGPSSREFCTGTGGGRDDHEDALISINKLVDELTSAPNQNDLAAMLMDLSRLLTEAAEKSKPYLCQQGSPLIPLLGHLIADVSKENAQKLDYALLCLIQLCETRENVSQIGRVDAVMRGLNTIIATDQDHLRHAALHGLFLLSGDAENRDRMKQNHKLKTCLESLILNSDDAATKELARKCSECIFSTTSNTNRLLNAMLGASALATLSGKSHLVVGALKILKMKSLLTMGLSTWAYSWFYGWPFAAGMVRKRLHEFFMA